MNQLLVTLTLALITATSSSSQATPSLKVTDLEKARLALRRGANPIQDGKVITPWQIDYAKMFCMSFGFQFDVRPDVAYPIEEAKARPNSRTTWEMNVRVNTLENPEQHRFGISCYSPWEPSLSDVDTALSGVYDIIETP